MMNNNHNIMAIIHRGKKGGTGGCSLGVQKMKKEYKVGSMGHALASNEEKGDAHVLIMPPLGVPLSFSSLLHHSFHYFSQPVM